MYQFALLLSWVTYILKYQHRLVVGVNHPSLAQFLFHLAASTSVSAEVIENHLI
jgi:hypothetical protein